MVLSVRCMPVGHRVRSGRIPISDFESRNGYRRTPGKVVLLLRKRIAERAHLAHDSLTRLTFRSRLKTNLLRGDSRGAGHFVG